MQTLKLCSNFWSPRQHTQPQFCLAQSCAQSWFSFIQSRFCLAQSWFSFTQSWYCFAASPRPSHDSAIPNHDSASPSHNSALPSRHSAPWPYLQFSQGYEYDCEMWHSKLSLHSWFSLCLWFSPHSRFSPMIYSWFSPTHSRLSSMAYDSALHTYDPAQCSHDSAPLTSIHPGYTLNHGLAPRRIQIQPHAVPVH